jgi:hypothetical protein
MLGMPTTHSRSDVTGKRRLFKLPSLQTSPKAGRLTPVSRILPFLVLCDICLPHVSLFIESVSEIPLRNSRNVFTCGWVDRKDILL